MKIYTGMLAAILTISGAMTMPAVAQRIQTVDKNGNPIPYASIMTMDTKVIGATGLDGILENVMSADTICISHVAYKSKKVKLDGKGGRITLEDADFDLPAITVTEKPLIYQQIYYRIIAVSDSAGLVYYRAGIIENGIDRKTNKVDYDENHLSMSSAGFIKTLLNAAFSAGIKRWVDRLSKPVEERMKESWKDIDLKFTPDGANRKRMSDRYGDVGYIVDDPAAGLRRVACDIRLMGDHRVKAKGKAKDIKKREERQASEKNRQDTDYALFRLNADGTQSPEDFVTLQSSTSYEKENSGSNFTIMELYTTDRGYVTNDELKKIREENKTKMTYANIRQFERQHKIQPLPAVVQQKIDQFKN